MTDQATLTPVDGDPWQGVTLTPVEGDPFAGPLTIHATNWKGPVSAGGADQAAAMPGEGSAAGPLQRAYPPDPTRGFVTPVETPNPAPIDPLAALSNLLYGNPQGLATSGDQLSRATTGLPAQVGSNIGRQFEAGSDLASAGVQNLKAGNIVAGVPQTMLGTLDQVASPLTGVWSTIGENVDPALDPGVGNAAPHIAPHMVSASDVLPAIFGGAAARAASVGAEAAAAGNRQRALEALRTAAQSQQQPPQALWSSETPGYRWYGHGNDTYTLQHREADPALSPGEAPLTIQPYENGFRVYDPSGDWVDAADRDAAKSKAEYLLSTTHVGGSPSATPLVGEDALADKPLYIWDHTGSLRSTLAGHTLDRNGRTVLDGAGRVLADLPPGYRAGHEPTAPLGLFEEKLSSGGMDIHSLGQRMFGNYASSSHVHQYSDGTATIQANIIDPETKAQIGTSTREFRPNGEIYHSYFHLSSAYQGKDISRVLMKQQIPVYQDLGYNKVKVHANIDVGAYTWARYGFVPELNSWSSLRAGIADKLDRLAASGKVNPRAYTQVKGLLESRDPRTIWNIADIREPFSDPQKPKTNTLGKALLLGSSWHGSLDLSDAATMERFNKYVGH